MLVSVQSFVQASFDRVRLLGDRHPKELECQAAVLISCSAMPPIFGIPGPIRPLGVLTSGWSACAIRHRNAVSGEVFNCVVLVPAVARAQSAIAGVAIAAAERLPPDSEARLMTFCELVSLAVASAQAREDLQSSRARIVKAGDEQRRKLERNLHDGAQQRFVNALLALGMAEAGEGAAYHDVERLPRGASRLMCGRLHTSAVRALTCSVARPSSTESPLYTRAVIYPGGPGSEPGQDCCTFRPL